MRVGAQGDVRVAAVVVIGEVRHNEHDLMRALGKLDGDEATRGARLRSTCATKLTPFGVETHGHERPLRPRLALKPDAQNGARRGLACVDARIGASPNFEACLAESKGARQGTPARFCKDRNGHVERAQDSNVARAAT